jgi:hypothetical protein
VSFAPSICRRTFMSSAALALSIGLVGCSSSPRSLRYRLSLYVDTPEGERSGTGVVEETEHYNDGMLESLGSVIITRLRGQATIVDLKQRGLMFCLLIGDSSRRESPWSEPMNLLSWTFRDRLVGDPPVGQQFDTLARERPRVALPLNALPMLVRFRDLSDPTSVERIDPLNLAAAFGPGVRLVRSTIEITDDPVTAGIEMLLPWLAGSSRTASIYRTGWPPSGVDAGLRGLTYYNFWSGRP